MKRLYITEEHRQIIEQLITNGSTKQLLKEENSTQRKKCVENITNNCPWQIREYINYKLEDLPYYLQEILNPSGQLYQQVSSATEGLNRLIDYLRLNLYSQFGIKRGTSLVRLIPGISRIACEDLKFYSFSYSIRGGDIIRLSRLLKLIDRKPEIMHIDGLNLDPNLNGLTYEDLMSLFD